MSALLHPIRLFLGTASSPIPDLSGWLRPAQEEGVAGLVGHVLARDPILAGRPDAAPFVEEHVQEFARNAHFMSRLAALGQSLDQRGLQALVLKGGALIPTAYGGVLGLRPLSDLDLLARPADRPAVEEVLREHAAVKGPPVPVDLHSDLVNSERIGSRTLAFRFDPEDLWASSRPLPGYPSSLRCLGVEHEALNLAAHALKHSHSRLAWLVDLALVLPAADPGRLQALARRTGTQRALAYAATLVDGMLGVTTDRRFSEVRLNFLERRYLEGVAGRRHSHLLGSVVVAFSVPRLGARVAYLWEAFFPSRRILRATFPGTPDWLLYPRRLAQLLRLFQSDRRRRART